MKVEHIDEAEYATWLTPGQALDSVRPAGLLPNEAAPAIVKLLRLGIVRAVAKHVHFHQGADDESHQYVFIPKERWEVDWIRNPASSFWRTALVDFVIRTGRYAADIEVQYVGVRIEPKVAAEFATGAPAPAKTATKAEGPPLGAAERYRFAKLYVEVFGDAATETKAVLAVRACYPDNFVSRDAFLEDFRAIRGKQVPGRKAKTGD